MAHLDAALAVVPEGEHWRADLRTVDRDTDSSELLATALVVLTNRRESEPHAQFAMPTVPAPEGLEQIHATADELAAVGTGYVLNEATGTRGEHSTSGQQARLWSRDGVLLATTEQLCWYR